jgi:hypothetical protein
MPGGTAAVARLPTQSPGFRIRGRNRLFSAWHTKGFAQARNDRGPGGFPAPARSRAPRDGRGGEEHLMISFRFEHVRLESFGLNFPESLLSSKEIEDRIEGVKTD